VKEGGFGNETGLLGVGGGGNPTGGGYTEEITGRIMMGAICVCRVQGGAEEL